MSSKPKFIILVSVKWKTYFRAEKEGLFLDDIFDSAVGKKTYYHNDYIQGIKVVRVYVDFSSKKTMLNAARRVSDLRLRGVKVKAGIMGIYTNRVEEILFEG